MKCTACRARLEAYYDGELSRGDALLMAGHLAQCAACSAHSRTLVDIENKLRRVGAWEPAPDFTIAVMAKIAALPAPHARRTRAWWLVTYVLAAWAALGSAIALHAIGWQTVVADFGVFVGKLGVAGHTLYRLADHYHLTTVAALGATAEVIMLAAIAIVGRKYLSRIGATLLGARMQ